MKTSSSAKKRRLQTVQNLRPLTENIIKYLQPSHKAETSRKHIVKYLKSVLQSRDLDAFEIGSFSWKTYLPDSDVDIGFISNKKYNNSNTKTKVKSLESSIGDTKNEAVNATTLAVKDVDTQNLMAINELLCLESCKQNKQNHSTPTVRNVSFVSGHVKVVKCVVNNVTIDLCSLQRESLAAVSYFEGLDRLIGNNHLFKRSLILIKGWCTYEGVRFANATNTTNNKKHFAKNENKTNNSNSTKADNSPNTNSDNDNNNVIIGASKGGLSSYGLTILISSFFIQHMKPTPSSRPSKNNANNNTTTRATCSIQHPLDAFILFIIIMKNLNGTNIAYLCTVQYH